MVFHNGHCKIRWCGIWWKSAGIKYVSPQNQVCWVQICLFVKFSEILGVLHAAGNTNLWTTKCSTPKTRYAILYIQYSLYDICKYIIKYKSILITVIVYIYTHSYLHVCKEKQIERESWLEVPFVFYGCTGLASKPCQPLALALGAAYQGACKTACLWENNHHLSLSIYIFMCVYLILT